MALPQNAIEEIMRIAREAARDHYQGEQRVFEQRYQHDIQGAAREIRELTKDYMRISRQESMADHLHQQTMKDYRRPTFDLVRMYRTTQERN